MASSRMAASPGLSATVTVLLMRIEPATRYGGPLAVPPVAANPP